MKTLKNNTPKSLSLLFLITLLLISACETEKESDSLKIATFNTFLRSTLMYCMGTIITTADCLAQYDGIPEANANLIADEILQGDYDVIALNEVFDEEASVLSRLN